MATQRKLAQQPPLTHGDEKTHRELIARAVADLQTRLAGYLDNIEKTGAVRPDFAYFAGQW